VLTANVIIEGESQQGEALMNLTAVFEKDEDWYIAYIEEIPGVNTQGRTLEEAKANLIEAFQLLMEANRDEAERELVGKHVTRQKILV